MRSPPKHKTEITMYGFDYFASGGACARQDSDGTWTVLSAEWDCVGRFNDLHGALTCMAGISGKEEVPG